MSDHNSFLDIDRKIMGDCNTSTESMDNLIVLCDDFGSRFGGTEGERQAAEFFKAKMEDYGLSNIRVEPFEYIGWTRGEATLEIIEPVQKTIPCISLPHSPAATLEGEIIDMGDGAPQDFDDRAEDIKGKIVMTSSVVSPKGSKRWIHRSEKYERSILAGASAFIFVNHYPGFGPATGGIGHDGEALVPGISIAYEDGAFIKRLAKRHGAIKIRLTTGGECRPMTSWNVMGDLPGIENPDVVVMAGSHYDGHDISQGAEDPASGVVSVLEAARLLAQHAPALPYTLRFVLWGVEEIGLLGSRAYVETHADELDNIRFYLNMDAAGSASNNRDIVLNEWPELEALMERWGEEMTADFAIGQATSAFSDHFPFFMAGVPTGGMQSAVQSLAGRGYGHTQYDTVDKVKLSYLREAAALAARLMLRMASDAEWPVSRRDESDVHELLDGPDFRVEEELRGRVKELYETARA